MLHHHLTEKGRENRQAQADFSKGKRGDSRGDSYGNQVHAQMINEGCLSDLLTHPDSPIRASRSARTLSLYTF